VSGSLTPRHGGTAPMDGGNQYKSVQHKLMTLGEGLDEIADSLDVLLRRMRTNADRTHVLAAEIANAELDLKFVRMTKQVATALDGASTSVLNLHQAACELFSRTGEARDTHKRMYGALDEVRNRPERTPKPGFLVH
jgi:hypothetical protein